MYYSCTFSVHYELLYIALGVINITLAVALCNDFYGVLFSTVIRLEKLFLFNLTDTELMLQNDINFTIIPNFSVLGDYSLESSESFRLFVSLLRNDGLSKSSSRILVTTSGSSFLSLSS